MNDIAIVEKKVAADRWSPKRVAIEHDLCFDEISPHRRNSSANKYAIGVNEDVFFLEHRR